MHCNFCNISVTTNGLRSTTKRLNTVNIFGFQPEDRLKRCNSVPFDLIKWRIRNVLLPLKHKCN